MMPKIKWNSSYNLTEDDKRIVLESKDRSMPTVEVEYDDIDSETSVSYVDWAVRLAYVNELMKALADVKPYHPLLTEIRKREEVECEKIVYVEEDNDYETE
jgi:hypothetical protein